MRATSGRGSAHRAVPASGSVRDGSGRRIRLPDPGVRLQPHFRKGAINTSGSHKPRGNSGSGKGDANPETKGRINLLSCIDMKTKSSESNQLLFFQETTAGDETPESASSHTVAAPAAAATSSATSDGEERPAKPTTAGDTPKKPVRHGVGAAGSRPRAGAAEKARPLVGRLGARANPARHDRLDLEVPWALGQSVRRLAAEKGLTLREAGLWLIERGLHRGDGFGDQKPGGIGAAGDVSSSSQQDYASTYSRRPAGLGNPAEGGGRAAD